MEKRAHKARTEKPLAAVKKTGRQLQDGWDASCCNAGMRSGGNGGERREGERRTGRKRRLKRSKTHSCFRVRATVDTKAARLPFPSFIPLAHPSVARVCVCVCVCVCLLCFFQFSHFVGEERKEERKEGQRDKSDPSNGGREEGEGVRDMNYYRALVHGKGADRRTVTLFVKYNFERFGRQQFFPSSSPLFPLFFFEGERRSEIALREFGEGRFLFLSIVIRILYNNYYKVK